MNGGCDSCEARTQNLPCMAKPMMSCVCDAGYAKATSSGPCVPVSQCPRTRKLFAAGCAMEEEFKLNAGCDSCANRQPGANNTACATAPQYSCVCASGYGRNPAGKCVKLAQCPKAANQCDANATYKQNVGCDSCLARTQLLPCATALQTSCQWISYLSITATTDAFFCGRVQSEADSCKIGYYSNQIFQFVGMATGVVGLYVTDKYGIKLSNGIFLALGTIVFMLSVCIRRGCPPTPPSPSSAHHNAFSLRQGLANIFKTPSYVILLVPFGLAFAINWSVFIVTDAILDSLDYGEVIRICYAGIVVTSIALDVLLHHKSDNSPWMKALMILLFISLGAFCIPIFPIGIELGVEMTFPVPEATSSGVLVIFGNALMFAVSFGMDLLAENVKGYFMHYPFTNNYWLALDFWCVLSVIGLLIVVFALNPKYKRLEFEQTAIADSCAESHTDRKGSGSQATEVTNFSQNANDTSTKKERKTSENQATIYRL
ncbi:unnamed protein product, partial [Mesorhabditis spiculigera]